MNLDKLLRSGGRPWAPSPDSFGLDVWHEYDVPTVGHFRMPTFDLDVLFTILGSPDERLTLWAYTTLTESRVKELTYAGFQSVAELGDVVDRQFAGQQAVFAIADGFSIWRWGVLEVPPAPDGIHHAAAEFLGQVRQSLERAKTPAAEIQVKLAGIEAAKDELISA